MQRVGMSRGSCFAVKSCGAVLFLAVMGGIVSVKPGSAEESAKAPSPSPKQVTLRVMTLNVAHGRKLSRHQTLLSRAAIEGNLADIAGVIRQEKPDVVALQEADGPSFWSGNFDHVAHIGNLAEVDHHFRGAHVAIRARNTHLSYGTAMLSRWPLGSTKSHAFAPSPPTPKKGFVIGSVTLPGSAQTIDVVSVHLDFLSKRQRNKQIRQMIDEVRKRENPLIVLGDMNCGWGRNNGSLQLLARNLDIHTFQPSKKIATFPARRPRRRIDWIFASDEFAFTDYRSLPDPVSDHLGVIAELNLTLK